jgi:hypothetical protein
MADNLGYTEGAGKSVASDEISTVHYQRIKITQGAEGAADGDTSTALPLPVRNYAGTGTQSSVSGAASDTTILAANTSRRGATVYNDSTAILYILLANATSSATVFTVKVAAGGYYEAPYGYTGIIKGIWASATGSARVTELT